MMTCITINDASEVTTKNWCPNNHVDVFDAKTLEVFKDHAGNNSHNSYKMGTIKFIVWVFYNRQHYGWLLKQSFLCAIEFVHKKDILRLTKTCRSSKQCDYICAICRKWIKVIMPNNPKMPLSSLDISPSPSFLAILQSLRHSCRIAGWAMSIKPWLSQSNWDYVVA